MKATDLMVGDYISVKPSGMPIKVAAVHHKKVAYHAVINKLTWVRESLLEPILLTPEILEKNGFVLKPDGWLWCKEEGIDDKNYIFIQFRKGCDEVRLVELNFVNKVLAKYEQIHYAHELQHALRLCGIKKEIVL